MVISEMLSTVLVSSIFAVVLAGLVAGAVVIRGRQSSLNAKREAGQLQRRADHLFKIALAAQVHTRHNLIARTLLEEALRVLEHSSQLDRDAESTAHSLRECRELIANLDAEPERSSTEARDPTLEFPEAELIEAQLHLTEAMRLLIGLEKRGQMGYDALTEMTIALKQAQRAIDLRLQLHQATQALAGDRGVPKSSEAQATDYLASVERSLTQSSR